MIGRTLLYKFGGNYYYKNKLNRLNFANQNHQTSCYDTKSRDLKKKCREKYRKKFFHIVVSIKHLKSGTDYHVLNIQYSVRTSLPMKIIQILLLKQ